MNLASLNLATLSAAPCRAIRFEVLADAEPGLLPRLLGSFARRDLTPDQVRARRTGTCLLVEIGLEALPTEMLHLIEGNLRQTVGVRHVTTELRTARAA